MNNKNTFDLITERFWLFDNARFFSIYLIVFCHFIDHLTRFQNKNLLYLYQYIYVFHIPMLAIISGYFSRSKLNNTLFKSLLSIGFPFIIFETLYRLFIYFFIPETQLIGLPFFDESIPYVSPYWLMWYLSSLLVWRMILPFFSKLPYPLIVAIILGLSIGVIVEMDKYFCLQRTLTFLPFFIAGFQIRQKGIEHYIKKVPWWSSVLIILICFPIVYNQVFPGFFLFGRVGYKIIFGNILVGITTRLFYYGISFILCFSFFRLIPNRRMLISAIGKRSIYIYLLHGFIILIMRSKGLLIPTENVGGIVAIIILPLFLTIILTSKPVCMLTKYLISPQLLWGKANKYN